MNNQDRKTVEYENKSASENLTIREWRQDDKPRERLQLFGAHCLSDSELLAILINTGMQNFSALDIA